MCPRKKSTAGSEQSEWPSMHDKGIANGSYKWLAKQIGKNTRNDEGMITIFGDEWLTDGISSPGGVTTS